MTIADLTNRNLKTLSSVSTENALVLICAKVKIIIVWPLCFDSKTTVSRTFHAVFIGLKCFGARHMTQAERVTHTNIFTKCFYGDKMIFVLDILYIYRPKTSDHKPQRALYSGQKSKFGVAYEHCAARWVCT